MPRCRRVLAAVAFVVGFTGACGGGGAPARPTTSAQLQILSPTPNEVTGPNVKLQFRLIGATVVPPAVVKGKLRGDEGHIHVFLDNRLISMTYGLSQQLTDLTPGNHALAAEFVAVDHLPFRNRVRTGVLFRVA
jgi:hypothetical protein